MSDLDVVVYRVPFGSIVQESELKSFETEVSRIIDTHTTLGLAIDFGRTFHVSSRTLGLLVTFLKRLQEKKGRLALFGVNTAIQRVMQVTQIYRLVPIVADEAQAMAMLRRSDGA